MVYQKSMPVNLPVASSSHQEAPKCTLMAATAITKAIEDVTGVKVGIKWPNDVLYEG